MRANHKSEPEKRLRIRLEAILRDCADILVDLEDIGDVIVFGGAARDMTLLSPRAFHRDIDLVVDGEPSTVRAVCARWGATVNKFGGCRISRGSHLRPLDVWPLTETWAFRHGLVDLDGPSSLLRTTYFTLDSIAYCTKTNEVLACPSYYELLSDMSVDMVLPQNPNPVGALKRTIDLLFRKGAKLEWTLAKHTLELLAGCDVGTVQATIHACGSSLTASEFYRQLDGFVKGRRRSEGFRVVLNTATDQSSQLRLPL